MEKRTKTIEEREKDSQGNSWRGLEQPSGEGPELMGSINSLWGAQEAVTSHSMWQIHLKI
jgi:hypothetical protein